MPGDAKAVADLSCRAFCQTYADACHEWIVALDDCMVICVEDDE